MMKQFFAVVALLAALITSVAQAAWLIPSSGTKLGAGGHLKMHRVVTINDAAPDSSLTVAPSGVLSVKGLRIDAELLITPVSKINSLGAITATPGQINKVGLVSQAGLIQMWATTTPPSGWLFCDGSAVSRTTYADLFSVIGTTFGLGDGSTTFNLPSLKGRVPVMLDASQTEFDALGEVGGAKAHQLTIAELPAHNHQTSTPFGHTADVTNERRYATSANPQPNHIATTTETGGGEKHNNLQPYIVLTYIIKY
jgi:microcystin-dependent protein